MAKKSEKTISDILKRNANEKPLIIPKIFENVPGVENMTNDELAAAALTHSAQSCETGALKEYFDRREGKVKEIVSPEDIGQFIPKQAEEVAEKIKEFKRQKKAKKKAEARIQ